MTEQNYKGTPPPLSTSKKRKRPKTTQRKKSLCVTPECFYRLWVGFTPL